MIIYENDYAIVDGYKFRKDQKTGYYLSNNINGRRLRLHRYIYEKYNGEIPKGYDIHHKDHNKKNNTLENLDRTFSYTILTACQCLPVSRFHPGRTSRLLPVSIQG